MKAGVQAELEEVLGGRGPRLEDRPHLPYTEVPPAHHLSQATIMEVQRVANIAPQGVIHVSDKDLVVNGLTVPANTMIVGLYTEILKGSHWEDGLAFRPERFLDAEGRVIRDPQFIPFAIGDRVIIGLNSNFWTREETVSWRRLGQSRALPLLLHPDASVQVPWRGEGWVAGTSCRARATCPRRSISPDSPYSQNPSRCS